MTASPARITSPPEVIVCPFCPLHCDDVTLDPQGRPVVACDLAKTEFRRALGTPTPPRLGADDPSLIHIAGADDTGDGTDTDTHAIERHIAATIRDRVKTAERIALVTAGTDLQTARDLDDLASADPRVSIRIDASPTRQAIATAVSREGVVAATIADVRRHADQIWLLGIRPEHYPRLLDRLIDPDRPATVHRSPHGIAADDLASLVVADPNAPPKDITSTGLSPAFASSRYLTVIVGDHAFRPVEAEAAAELLVQWIHRRNANARAVIVQFDRAATNRCVAAWRGNRTLAADRDAITDNEVRIRIGAPNAINPEAAAPMTLQVGGDPSDPHQTQAYLPAAEFGVHRNGAVVRGDGTVTLPLSKIARSPLPTATQWLRSNVFATQPPRHSQPPRQI